MAHAHCMLDTRVCKYILRICNTYCFSTARTHHSVTLYVHCLVLSQSDLCLPTHCRCTVLLLHLLTFDDTPHSIELLWTRDRPSQRPPYTQHTRYTTDRYPCPRPDSNPQSPQASGLAAVPRRRPRGHCDRLMYCQLYVFIVCCCTVSRLHTVATNRCCLPQVRPSVRTYQPGSHWMDFLEIWYWGF